MHIQRLRDLSALLHKLEAQRSHDRALGLPVQTVCCRTAGNAIQIAGESFHFQSQGFRLERIGEPPTLTPRYGDLIGADAIEAFFEIDEFTAEVLFDPAAYDESEIASPGPVARRIDFWLPAASPADNTARVQAPNASEVVDDRLLALRELAF